MTTANLIATSVNPSSKSAHASSLLDYYKAIEGASRQMLEAAQAEDWDQVVRLEGACAVLIEQLRAESRSQNLGPKERAENSASCSASFAMMRKFATWQSPGWPISTTCWAATAHSCCIDTREICPNTEKGLMALFSCTDKNNQKNSKLFNTE